MGLVFDVSAGKAWRRSLGFAREVAQKHARAIDLYRHNAACFIVVQDDTLSDFNRTDARFLFELQSQDVRFLVVDGFRFSHYLPRGIGRPGRRAQTSPSRTNVS